MISDWIEQYTQRFNENFPLFMLKGRTEDELIGIIKDCLKTGKPYVPPDNDAAIDY